MFPCCCQSSSSSSSSSSGSNSGSFGEIETGPCVKCDDGVMSLYWEFVLTSAIGPFAIGTYITEDEGIGGICTRIYRQGAANIRQEFEFSGLPSLPDILRITFTDSVSIATYQGGFFSGTIDCSVPLTLNRISGSGQASITIEPVPAP